MQNASRSQKAIPDKRSLTRKVRHDDVYIISPHCELIICKDKLLANVVILNNCSYETVYLWHYSYGKIVLELHCCDNYIVFSSIQAKLIFYELINTFCCACCALSHKCSPSTNVFVESVQENKFNKNLVKQKYLDPFPALSQQPFPVLFQFHFLEHQWYYQLSPPHQLAPKPHY